jgi:hypothetical protein
MPKLIYEDKHFISHEYEKEKDFELEVVQHAKAIFGPQSLYVYVKKRIGEDNIVTIPDGYLIDFSFVASPKLYIVENELAKHDPYRHIGQQLLKFAISYKASGRKIKQFLLDKIMEDGATLSFVTTRFENAGYRNIDAFLEAIIFDNPVSAIVVIDQSTEDLENVLAQLSMDTDIVEFTTYASGDEKIHWFTPFQQEIRDVTESPGTTVSVEELDTIVVPALEEGFNEVFLGQDCWYAIRISSAMLGRIKYIAGYQTAPISAITNYAEVASIDKYKDTNKYIVYFKEKAKKIGPIKLPKESKGLVPYSPRYTSFSKLVAAKTLRDIY